MELTDPDFAQTFKAEVKRFREQGDEVSFDFAGRTTAGAPVGGRVTLARAEYEVESCLQVLVRPSAAAPAAGARADGAPGLSIGAFLQRGTTRLAAEVDDFDALELELGLGEMDTVVEEIHAALTAGAEDAEVARIAHHRFAMIVTAEGSDQIDALAGRRCRDSAASTTRSGSSVSSRSTSSSSTAHTSRRSRTGTPSPG